MRVYTENKDIEAKSTAPVFHLGFVEDIGKRVLVDQRDQPLFMFFANVFIGPFAFLMTMVFLVPAIPYVSPILALLYTAFVVGTGFTSKYVLATHYAFHRPIFNSSLLSALHDHILCTLGIAFGFAPGVYRLHHCVMHHVENNGTYDFSQTEEYDRSKLSSLVHYWAKFYVGIFLYLPYYAFTRKMWGALARFAFWRLIHTLFIIQAYKVNPTHTMLFLIIPSFIMVTALSIGNYFQHILVDPDNSRSNYHLTYNIIHTVDNQALFNDCYHITHHLNSQIHWTDMPKEFHKKVETYAKNDALVFEGITIVHVGYFVLSGQFEKLAGYLVNLPGVPKRNTQQWVDILKHRTKPIKKA